MRHDAGVKIKRDHAAVVAVVTVAALAMGGAFWFRTTLEQPTEDAVSTPATSSAPPEVRNRTLTIKRPAEGPMTVQFIGDSISNGWAATTDQDGYVAKTVAAWSAEGPVAPRVDAVSGAKMWEVGKFVQVAPKASLVVIELGTNDARESEETAAGEFHKQYTALVDRVTKEAPYASVVCLGTWRPAGRGGTFDRQIYDVCDGRANALYLALDDLYTDPALRGPAGRPVFLGNGDVFHPNDAGYTAITKRITDNVTLMPAHPAAK